VPAPQQAMESQGGRESLVIVAAGPHFMATPPGDDAIACALAATAGTASR